jgi:hypothetical protein
MKYIYRLRQAKESVEKDRMKDHIGTMRGKLVRGARKRGT